MVGNKQKCKAASLPGVLFRFTRRILLLSSVSIAFPKGQHLAKDKSQQSAPPDLRNFLRTGNFGAILSVPIFGSSRSAYQTACPERKALTISPKDARPRRPCLSRHNCDTIASVAAYTVLAGAATRCKQTIVQAAAGLVKEQEVWERIKRRSSQTNFRQQPYAVTQPLLPKIQPRR